MRKQNDNDERDAHAQAAQRARRRGVTRCGDPRRERRPACPLSSVLCVACLAPISRGADLVARSHTRTRIYI